LIVIANLSFSTPFGGLLVLAAALPLAAYYRATRRDAMGRSLLQLPAPAASHRLVLAAVILVPALLGIAASGPVFRHHTGRRIRTGAQAIFIFDTSRSMAASANLNAPTRLEQAQGIAIRLRDDAIPDVASGVASLTTELLPHLFPTIDEAAFNSTVRAAIGVERPPPPFLQYGVSGTSFSSLTQLRNQGYFTPSVKKRVAILLTDGESGPISATAVVDALTSSTGGSPFPRPGVTPAAPEAPVSLLIVRLGSKSDRIFDQDGDIEGAYRPDPTAASTVSSLVAASDGQVVDASAGHAAASLRSMFGAAGNSVQGSSTATLNLAPYLVLSAFAPLALLLWRRNLAKL
jgi:hypothetical protein